ncbi:drug resistance transporter, EmrB/QacA subfamily [Actinacidiphila yanglinensis]|uniref:Drug resistance transporter, EmrB/QacA subfamily n=1 Tax=Actinacidiphila yanglinensis TaxID=310779 RepID=A0A1H5XJZ1_9ACTN|nr:MFS transporter [Actinacidiphila yanglinensis]SEG11953.1 drug resistance transporter, EmrB/QacA subfamily [Actinacidiphila yanglinensis]
MSTQSAADAPVGASHRDSPVTLDKQTPEEHPSHRWWVLGVIAIAQLMVVLDATVVNIALPSAQKALDFSDGNRQWIVTAYSLSFGSLLLLGGRLADLIGRKIVFLIGVVGFALASALAGAAQNFDVLVSGRALQGLFGALLAPAALSLLNTTFTDSKERAKAFGIYGAIAGAGGGIGLLLGGVLTEHLSWRWTLYVNLVFAVIAFIGGMTLLRKGAPAARPRLDVPGTVLVTAGLFSIVYGFSNADSHHWGSPLTWGFLLLGVVLVAAFGWWQTRAQHPLLPLRVLLDRNRGASFAILGISGVGMFGVFLFLTYYLQLSLQYNPVKTGLAFLPMIGSLMVAAQLATNNLLPKFGPRPIVPVGMGLAGVGMAWLTTLDLNSTYAANVLPPLIVIGLGLGLVMPTVMSVATAGVHADDAGVASAGVNTMQQVGGSIGTALLNTLAASAATSYLHSHAHSGTPAQLVAAHAQLHSYSTAYWWSAGFFAVGTVLAALMFRSGRPEQSPAGEAQAVHM